MSFFLHLACWNDVSNSVKSTPPLVGVDVCVNKCVSPHRPAGEGLSPQLRRSPLPWMWRRLHIYFSAEQRAQR